MIVFVDIDQFLVFDLQEKENRPVYGDIKMILSSDYGYDYQRLVLLSDGNILDDSAAVKEEIFILACYTNTILGGKGGFGAALRSKAKQKALKATTDFGACRDLNGRRLRHVNDEILLQKFNEAKERGEKLKVDEDTPTGIDMWYLSKPSWAETEKKSSRAKLLKRVGKTELCRDWVAARENASPPEGAPLSWGCPRGDRCTFAHGIDELRGEKKVEIISTQRNEKKAVQEQKRDEYVRSSKLTNDIEDRNESIVNAIRQGLMSSSSSTSKGYAEEKAPIDDILPLDDYGFNDDFI